MKNVRSLIEVLLKFLPTLQVNQFIRLLAINRPVMYVKQSKIVTLTPPLCICFSNLDYFSVFFTHKNHSTSKNTKESVVLTKSAYS